MAADGETIQIAIKYCDAFRKRTLTASDSFGVLRTISLLAASPDHRPLARELVLRSLESRHLFSDLEQPLDSLVRELELYPYLNPEKLGIKDLLAFEMHRPVGFPEEVVFHHPQAEVYWRLTEGKNVVLSAPTSFGKSLIIDALLSSQTYKNVLIIVPTIALMDETRRRLVRNFGDKYKIITHTTQDTATRNVFVLTQERYLEAKRMPQLDLFIVDEFYKLSPTMEEDGRAELLNVAVHKLIKSVPQFYMLGPGIRNISKEFQEQVRVEVIEKNDFQTVVSEHHHVPPGKKPLEKLVKLIEDLSDPTIVFCSSPTKASAIVHALIESRPRSTNDKLSDAASWMAKTYHQDWHVALAVSHSIGVHHARMPRSIASFMVRAFDEGLINVLVCTPTLIEGVNTKAKNMVIFDDKIDRQPIDTFTFNNICGRAGRAFKHFVGHVYLFYPPPQTELPIVEMPAFSQGVDASESLLIQLDEKALSTSSKDRLKRFRDQKILSYSVLQENTGINPEQQLAFATELDKWPEAYSRHLFWSNRPSWDQLHFVCRMMWDYFGGGGLARRAAANPKHLAYLLDQLRRGVSTRKLIEGRISSANKPDTAAQQTFDFLRLWASFHFPRLLRAIGRIQKDVLSRKGIRYGNFDFYASEVEHLFQDPAIMALDEYGIPIELAKKIQSELDPRGSIDLAIERLKRLTPVAAKLSKFEWQIIQEVRDSI